jgi:predicted RNase H-like HicB family nuclease
MSMVLRPRTAGDTETEVLDHIEDAIRLYLAPSELQVPENANLVEATVGSGSV